MAASRARRSSPPSAPGLGNLGFLVQNGAEGKGILTRGSLTAGWVPRWFTAASWSYGSSMVAHDLDWASLASRSSSKSCSNYSIESHHGHLTSRQMEDQPSQYFTQVKLNIIKMERLVRRLKTVGLRITTNHKNRILKYERLGNQLMLAACVY
jgi:hypothetical protein